MKKYALSVGFNFQTFWSYYMTVELLLQHLSTPEKTNKATMVYMKMSYEQIIWKNLCVNSK